MTTETATKPAPRQRKLSIVDGEGSKPGRTRKPATPKNDQPTLTDALDKSKSHLGTEAGKPETQEKASETKETVTPPTDTPVLPDDGQPGNAAPDTNDEQVSTSLPEIGAEIMRAGTKNIAITYLPLSGRGGRNVAPELYPFGQLTPSVKVGAEIIGPSFFIPEDENPDSLIASARKRHKSFNFLTRKRTEQVDDKGPEVRGVRVWRGPENEKA